ncbi:MAG: ComEA family DNA-binding protein [Thermoguttaceae bacterium]
MFKKGILTSGDQKILAVFLVLVLLIFIPIAFNSGSRELNELEASTQQKSELPVFQVNLNTATEAELSLLPGIGPKLAVAIIEYRNANGNFTQTQDVKKVKGIADKKFAQIEKFLRL